MLADSLYDGRDRVALLPALALVAVLLTTSVPQFAKRGEEAPPFAISLSGDPAPREPEPVPPDPMPAPARREAPRRPSVEPAAREHLPAEAPAARAPADAPPRPPQPETPAPTPPATPAAAAPAVPPYVALENGYVSRLRAYLDGVKRYPTSREARSQRPRGSARLWLEIARDGTLLAAGLEESSGSMILDGAALSTVRQGRFPAFPPEAWAASRTHRFAVTLEYSLDPG